MEEILEVELIGIEDNFSSWWRFNKSNKVLNLLKKENMKLSIGDVFRYHTISLLAKKLKSTRLPSVER